MYKFDYSTEDEAREAFDKWKKPYFKYRGMDFEDAPVKLRNYFKKYVLHRRQQQDNLLKKKRERAAKEERKMMRGDILNMRHN